MAETLIDAFVEAAEQPSLGITFWEKPGRREYVTYASLLADALKVAKGLREKGLQPGERVAIVLPTGVDFYRSFFGILLAGGVPTALYPPMRLGRIEDWSERTLKMLKSAKCVALLTSNALLGLCGTPASRVYLRLGLLTPAPFLRQEQTYGSVVRTRKDLAVVQFSSGSTGNPKPVGLTHENILANARSIVGSIPGDWQNHRCVSWLPLYHDMGLIGCLVSTLVAKCKLTLLRPERFVARPQRWLEAISETKGTISVAPNFAFGLTTNRVQDKDLVDLDLSSWQVALCGAEPVHQETLDGFANRFAEIGFRKEALTPVYGLAEATLAVTFSRTDQEPKWNRFDSSALIDTGRAVLSDEGRAVASVGQPLPDVEICIRRNGQVAAQEGLVGNVWVRGPSVMQGYLDRPEANEAVFDNERWLDTGDTGFFFENELYLCGRAKDLIIINGRNHDPSFIEESLHGVPGIRPGCVSAFSVLDTDAHTEGLGVVVETKMQREQEKESLKQEITRRIQASTGLRVSFLEVSPAGTLPRTSSGKIRRQETRRLALAGKLEPAAKAGKGAFIKESIKGLWRQHSPTRAMRRSA